MVTFWERAAHSVKRTFSLSICYFGCFPFWLRAGGTVVLIAPVPGHCLLFTFYLINLIVHMAKQVFL